MDLGLTDRRVLVTGASGGIGGAIALAFAAEGARIALHYNRSNAAAQAIAMQAEQAGARHVATVMGDLSVSGSSTKVVDETVEKLDGLDVLVNNAGAMIARRPVGEIDVDLMEAFYQLNVFSLIEASTSALPHLADGNGGSIVNVSSISARNGGGAGSSLYCSTKAAVDGFTRSMGKELATTRVPVRVNAVAPGVIETEFHSQTPDDVMQTLATTIPMGRLGSAKECAASVLFLASPTSASYITGQIIDINGGQWMG